MSKALLRVSMYGPRQLVSEHRERLTLAVLALELGGVFLARPVLAQEEHGGLGERPFEVRITDLFARGAGAFVGRLLDALDQATVGDEVLDPGKTGDVVNLVEEHQRQDLGDAGDRAEPVEGVDVVRLGGARELEFKVREQGVIVVDEREVHRDALLDARVGEVPLHA